MFHPWPKWISHRRRNDVIIGRCDIHFVVQANALKKWNIVPETLLSFKWISLYKKNSGTYLVFV